MNQRRAISPMKQFLYACILYIINQVSFADHTLAYVSEKNEYIRKTMQQLADSYQVVCDLEHSNQMYVHSHEKNTLGSAWKQVALCFENCEDLKHHLKTFEEGQDHGFAGIAGVQRLLIVTYSWVNYEPEQLISIEMR